MPQMMPLNWILLFMFFSIVLIMFNIMNYYMHFNKFSSKMPFSQKFKTLYWKW
nr:ATP synthase F0 subunit 8 [Pseudogalepsus sp. JZ-2017]